ncbi:MAG: hypothetical protein JXI33_08760 [Candidatus Aminicenantes bacterium]|nr:hypothetical protein [Candidatus Aminicenantes bacterium]
MLRQLLLLLLVAQASPPGQNYLVMKPIQEAVQNGRFSTLEPICRPRILLDLEEPFSLSGFLTREQFIERIAIRLKKLTTEKLEWSSLQVDENIAVQSLNLIIMDRVSGFKVIYKLILFMDADLDPNDEIKWKLYYLRGLKM